VGQYLPRTPNNNTDYRRVVVLYALPTTVLVVVVTHLTLKYRRIKNKEDIQLVRTGGGGLSFIVRTKTVREALWETFTFNFSTPQTQPKLFNNNDLGFVWDEDNDEDEEDEENFIFVEPPPYGTFSEADLKNKKIMEHIQSHYPSRFEDHSTKAQCNNCGLEMEIKDHKPWVCGECDHFVLCVDCFANPDALLLHQQSLLPKQGEEGLDNAHGTEFFYQQREPRWDTKTKVYRVPSSIAVVKCCFVYYHDRKLLAQPFVQGQEEANTLLYSGREVLGDYVWFTVSEIEELVTLFSFGVPEISVGDIVGICSENRVEWAIVDFCCVTRGFVSAAIQHSLSHGDIAEILLKTPVKFLVASSKCLTKVLRALKSIDSRKSEKKLELEKVIVLDKLTDFQEEIYEEISHMGIKIQTFESVLQEGHKKFLESGETVEEQRGKTVQLRYSDLRAIVFTSGTTGVPKAVTFQEKQWRNQLVFPMTFRNTVLYGYLPLDHMAGRVDLYTALFNGGRITFPSPIFTLDSFFSDIQKIRPTAFGPVPLCCNAVYEMFQTAVQKRLDKALASGTDPSTVEQGRKIIERQERAKLRYVFGDRLSSIKISSAPVTPQVINFLRKTLKIVVNEGYGSTEVGSITKNGVVTQKVKLVSVPSLGYNVDNDPPQGEVLVQNTRATEYYNDKKATKEKWSKGGWFRTGDIAEQNGPHSLVLIDRISNIVKLSNGEFVALNRLEELFQSESVLIHQIMVYADAFRSTVVAIIVPNQEYLDEYKSEYEDSIQEENENEKMQKEAEKKSKGKERYEEGENDHNRTTNTKAKDEDLTEVSQKLSESVRKDLLEIAKQCGLRSFEIPVSFFLELEISEWTSNDGLLTNTNKMCRKNLRKKYFDQIELLYLEQTVGKILGLDDLLLDPTKTFNELGGDSLSAMHLIEELEKNSIHISFERLMNEKLGDLIPRLKQEQSNKKEEVMGKKLQGTLVSAAEEEKELNEVVSSLLSGTGDVVSVIGDNVSNKTTNRFLVSTKHQTFFITGASGFLGGNVLRELLAKHPKAKVFCLVRRPGSALSQVEHEEDLSRVTELFGDLTKPLLGLDEDQFQELGEEVDDIIHSGALVNHLISYQDLYNTNVRSVFEIIKLALYDNQKVKPIHYISSTSAYSTPAFERGYGSSKWVVDKLLCTYGEKFQLPVSIFRPCLLIGHRATGQVNPKDWFHLLLKAILDFKLLPSFRNVNREADSPDDDGNNTEYYHSTQDGSISMVPVDFCASAIVELLPCCQQQQSNIADCVFNIAYNNISFNQLFEMIYELLVKYDYSDLEGDEWEVLEYPEWYSKMYKKVSENKHGLLPLISRLKHGVGGFDSSYDTTSLESFSSATFQPMTLQDLEKAIHTLQALQ